MKNKTFKIILILIIIVAIALLIIKMTETNPRVQITTTEGSFILELYPESAPITVENFISYVKDGFYDNTVFHRVIEGFMVQGGGFLADGTEKETKDPIKLESQNGLKNQVGTIAMARTYMPNSATSQFFINTNDNNFLNYGTRDDGYAVFGKVVEGFDTIKKIESVQTSTKNNMEDWPIEDIIILKVEII